MTFLNQIGNLGLETKEEIPLKESRIMPHYYYFPFPPGSGDKHSDLARKNILNKYHLGRATVERYETKFEGEVPYGQGTAHYDGFINAQKNPQKTYAMQDIVEIQCTCYKVSETVWQKETKQPLLKIHAGDVLMVDGHCGESSSTICNKETSAIPGAVTYEPRELAFLLLVEGLNDGVIVKLMVCYGGGKWGSDPNSHEDYIYAKKLARLIGSKRPNVIVGGYAGKLIVGERKARGPLGPNDHPTVSTVEFYLDNHKFEDLAKLNLRYYDGKGNLVARPGKQQRNRFVKEDLLNAVTI